MEISMSILILDTNIIKHVHCRVGREGLATTCRLSRYDYVVKPIFRYLNRDMCGVDWQSSPVSTSMAPGRQKLFNTRAMSLS